MLRALSRPLSGPTRYPRTNEGRAGAAEVDVSYYLGWYNDLQAAFGANYQSAINHWLSQGLPNEGRRASLTFDVQYYLATYADLQARLARYGEVGAVNPPYGQVEGDGPEQIQGGAAEGADPSTCPRCDGKGCDHCGGMGRIVDDEP